MMVSWRKHRIAARIFLISIKSQTILPLILLVATITFPVIVYSIEYDNDVSAYGIVIRKQSSGNRIIIQPLEGKFLEEKEIEYYNNNGNGLICKGKVQSVYSNIVYSVAEECNRIEDIIPGSGVTFNRDIKIMQNKYDSKEKIDETVRENEWKKSSGIPAEILDDQFENMVKKSKIPVLLEIYATWCPRCAEFKPIIGEVAKDLEGKVRIAIADGEKNRGLEKQLGVKGYPSVYLFINGNIVDNWAGSYKDKKPVLTRINNKINSIKK